MSYDISLIDPVTKEELELDSPHMMRGGIYAVGGETRAHLNVTYNYGQHFRQAIEGGIRSIYGKTGAESIPIFDSAIARLKDDVSDDYWAATEGNAKRAIYQLRALAALRPDGVWSGD